MNPIINVIYLTPDTDYNETELPKNVESTIYAEKKRCRLGLGSNNLSDVSHPVSHTKSVNVVVIIFALLNVDIESTLLETSSQQRFINTRTPHHHKH